MLLAFMIWIESSMVWISLNSVVLGQFNPLSSEQRKKYLIFSIIIRHSLEVGCSPGSELLFSFSTVSSSSLFKASSICTVVVVVRISRDNALQEVTHYHEISQVLIKNHHFVYGLETRFSLDKSVKLYL